MQAWHAAERPERSRNKTAMRTTPFAYPFAARNIPWSLRAQAQARADQPFVIWLSWDETQART